MPTICSSHFISGWRTVDPAIQELEKRLALTTQRSEKAQLSWQLGNNYLRNENFEKAETCFRKAAEWQPANPEIQRLIAYCLFNQQKFSDARKILIKLLDEVPENQSAAGLLDAIEEAERTGRKSEITIETTLVSLSSEISEFARFILSQCAFKGISTDRVSEDVNRSRIYVGSARDIKFDIERLETIAKNLGTRRPFERSEYLLTAAKLKQRKVRTNSMSIYVVVWHRVVMRL